MMNVCKNYILIEVIMKTTPIDLERDACLKDNMGNKYFFLPNERKSMI
jgi:hypothetical protein